MSSETGSSRSDESSRLSINKPQNSTEELHTQLLNNKSLEGLGNIGSDDDNIHVFKDDESSKSSSAEQSQQLRKDEGRKNPDDRNANIPQEIAFNPTDADSIEALGPTIGVLKYTNLLNKSINTLLNKLPKENNPDKSIGTYAQNITKLLENSEFQLDDDKSLRKNLNRANIYFKLLDKSDLGDDKKTELKSWALAKVVEEELTIDDSKSTDKQAEQVLDLFENIAKSNLPDDAKELLTKNVGEQYKALKEGIAGPEISKSFRKAANARLAGIDEPSWTKIVDESKARIAEKGK